MKKNKWIIKVSILLLVFVVLFSILYFTNNLDNFINKSKEKLSKITVITIVFYVIFFLIEIIKGWITNKVSKLLFPDKKDEQKNETNQSINQTHYGIGDNVGGDKIIKK